LKKNKVFFRVDGNAQIGLGHMVRCIALAQMLNDAFEIVFVSKEIPSQTVEELKINNFKLYQDQDELSFFNRINNEAIVVLDGYHFDTGFQKKVRATGAKLVCIDDLHDMEFVADLIINHAPGVFPSDYKAQRYTQFALGLDYVLLRPLFLQQAKKTRTITSIDTVLICFGGADPKNLTRQTLETVLNAATFKKIIVVTGAAYLHEPGIKTLTKNNAGIEHYSAVGEAEMLALMLEADLAIVPSSGILFEVMAAGCKIISGYYADNQEIVFKRLKNAGAFIAAGNFDKADIESAIEKAKKNEKPPLKLIDGKSGKNILHSFFQILTSLRKAAYADCELIFNWANDQTVRANAFNPKPIAFRDHENWFDNKLKDERCHIFILSLHGADAGQIRFDMVENIAAISYLIDKDFRGLGLGSLIVSKGIDSMKAENKARRFIALVKLSNEASIRIFKHLGFVQKADKHPEYGNIYSFSLEL